MARSRLDRLLANSGTVDMMIYIHGHPGCRKSDIYSDVTRNMHVPQKLAELRDSGIVRMEEYGSRAFLYMTEKGDEIAESLIRIRELLGEDP